MIVLKSLITVRWVLCPLLEYDFKVQKSLRVYKQHVMKCAFGVRTRTLKRDDDNQLCYLKLVCAREGKYVSQIPGGIEDPPNPNKTMSNLLNNSKKTRSMDTTHCGT